MCGIMMRLPNFFSNLCNQERYPFVLFRYLSPLFQENSVSRKTNEMYFDRLRR